jgi:hypothetical protein
VRAEVAPEERPAAPVRGAVDAVAVHSGGKPGRRAVREGGAHADEGAVRKVVARDEDGRLAAAGPEGDHWAVGGVEAPEQRGQGSDGRRASEETA